MKRIKTRELPPRLDQKQITFGRLAHVHEYRDKEDNKILVLTSRGHVVASINHRDKVTIKHSDTYDPQHVLAFLPNTYDTWRNQSPVDLRTYYGISDFNFIDA